MAGVPQTDLGRSPRKIHLKNSNVMVDDLLNDLTSKFNSITSEITAKMDDMSRRIDNLEASMQSQRSENDSNQAS